MTDEKYAKLLLEKAETQEVVGLLGELLSKPFHVETNTYLFKRGFCGVCLRKLGACECKECDKLVSAPVDPSDEKKVEVKNTFQITVKGLCVCTCWAFCDGIKCSTRKIYVLEVDNKDTIKKIKKKIQDAGGLHPDQQCLILKGTQLENDRSLKDYKVQNKSEIRILVLLDHRANLATGFLYPSKEGQAHLLDWYNSHSYPERPED